MNDMPEGIYMSVGSVGKKEGGGVVVVYEMFNTG